MLFEIGSIDGANRIGPKDRYIAAVRAFDLYCEVEVVDGHFRLTSYYAFCHKLKVLRIFEADSKTAYL